jgi:hypothetical protein
MRTAAQSAGGSVAVHPVAVSVEQNRAAGPISYGAVDRPTHSWRQWDEGKLGALAQHTDDAVTVLFAEIVDGRVARFEDTKPEQAEHSDQGEVERVR